MAALVPAATVRVKGISPSAVVSSAAYAAIPVANSRGVPAPTSRRRLLSGSGVLGSRDERPDERGEEGLSPPARVVDHLEEGEVERQLLLGDAPVRPRGPV